jgi:precorrin-2 dehydrogenase/sirohydrochlorin ferrochelatase
MVLVMNTFNSKHHFSRALFRLAMRRGFLLNCHDQPQFSTFIMPALIQRGGLQIGISTGGMSPSISKRLKEDLEKIFDQEFEEYFEWVAARRSEIFKGRPSKKNRYHRLQKFLEDFKLSGKIQYPGRWKKES